MPTLRLPRDAFLAVLTLALQIVGSSGALADTPDTLGPVAQERASIAAGRSRVIVEFTVTADARVITGEQGRVIRLLSGQQAHVAELDDRAIARLAADARIARITVDRPVFATLARVGATTGATPARERFGVTGLGIGVAIIDSGIASWHDDLWRSLDSSDARARVVHVRDFTRDAQPGISDTASDGYGHGTHVAGIIAGSGYDSEGARIGMAPGAHLIDLKVLDAEGAGFISNVIEALDYAVAVKDVYNIRIINLSVASGVFESYWNDPLTRAARRAWDAGIVVFAAAGNLGADARGDPQYGLITSPGNAPWVVTVGASSHQGTTRRGDDTTASFSSRGPSSIDFSAKPDILAPGVGIESLSDPNTTLAMQFSAFLVNGARPTRYPPYLSLTGTSMAVPTVAGIAALMLEANAALTPDAVKRILEYTAQTLPGESPLAQGAGLVNAVGAVRMAAFWGNPEGVPGPAFDVIAGETVPWSRHLVPNVPMPGTKAHPGASAPPEAIGTTSPHAGERGDSSRR
jgi:subtilisin family serine protease